MNIKLTKAEKIKVLTSDDIYGIMQKILLREQKIDQDREHFWVVGLASNLRILFIEMVSLGTVNATYAKPMEVFSLALQKRAVQIIMCHNHPSGELQPSDADLNLTDRLIQVGIIVDTPVYDHLVISTQSYLSFRDLGLMDQLEKSTKFVPSFEIVERIKRETAKVAAKERDIELAKKLKRKGMEVQEIVELTGLTVTEVNKLRVRRKKE